LDAIRFAEVREKPFIDTMGAGDGLALSGLAENFGQRYNGDSAGSDNVGENCPGPTEGNWSMSSTITRAASLGMALSRDCINRTSTIDVSSITKRSPSSG
jgi:hypothetical protein